MKITAKQKEEWIAALESGKFPQGTGHLKQQRGDGMYEYCCLGVFCEINGFPQEPFRDLCRPTRFNFTIARDPDESLQSMYSLRQVYENVPENELTQMNDGGASFTEIADYIRKNVEVTES